MEKKNTNRKRRLRNLIIAFAFTAIFISIATYAWFIGMRTVHVNSFDVEISSAESLMLSLDGKTWGSTVAINANNFNDPTVVYTGNTNTWPEEGLVPVSSIGEMDITSSRLKVFEKASFTTTPGGYRLLASRVPNTTTSDVEPGGYVAFDLFVRNFSGRAYMPELEILNEEAIYLTVDSEVSVSLEGGVPNTGIENSVRVAFSQIGRVSGDELAVAQTADDYSKITGINCTSTGATATDTTGICREAKIWEPNDRAHVLNAIKWYNTSCKKRTGDSVTDKDSYTAEDCQQVIDGLYYPTYAVNDAIDNTQNVDVYDGAAFNTYDKSSVLTAHATFTDTMKNYRGVERPPFMYLAPNSITKVRVYVYIEGQDIDNYDFASIGKSIAVKFGFTKERFTEDDIEYDGPDLNQGLGPLGSDLTPPVITITGEEEVNHTLGDDYTDQGATALDNVDNDVTTNIIATGTVNKDVAGTYIVTYKVTDAAGNTATKTRTVIVE